MDKQTIVMVHGTGLGAWSWEPVRVRLEVAGLTARAIDLAGFGLRTPELSPELGLADHVRDIVAEIDACGGPAILVGHSYGAYAIGDAAAERSDKVAGVIFVDGPPARRNESLLDQIPALAPLFESLACPDAPGLIEPLPADLIGLDTARLPEGIAPTRSPLKPSLDRARNDSSSLSCAGLYIGFSAFSPSATLAANAAACGWPVAMLPGGHMALFHDPEPVAIEIAAFIRRLSQGPD